MSLEDEKCFTQHASSIHSAAGSKQKEKTEIRSDESFQLIFDQAY